MQNLFLNNLPYPLSCHLLTHLMIPGYPETSLWTRIPSRNGHRKIPSQSSTTKPGSRAYQKQNRDPQRSQPCGESNPGNRNNHLSTHPAGKLAYLFSSKFLKKPLSSHTFLRIIMANTPKPVTRDGVKGHVITVEEHKKFVPQKYDTGKKKGR